jgi:uncharacterized DUF497 family protein
MTIIDGFQWDENKSEQNRKKHGIDFDEATEVFYAPHLLYQSDRHNEERWVAVGNAETRILAVIFTWREREVRIIRLGVRGNMKNERIIRRSWNDRRKGKTDWAAVDALTDEQIEAAIANDPDCEEFKDLDWREAALIIPPKKQAISIRVDQDVLDFFKAEGTGYQRRMNAVLRSYMEHKKKKKRA